MKNFIVLVASILLIIIFPLQITLDVVNNYRISRFDEIVHRSTQTARTEGYFTDDNINELKNNILSYFPNVTEGEIIIDVETTPKYRMSTYDQRETIYYKIGVPIKKIVAANGLLGIPDNVNKANYIKEGYVLSEVLP